MYNLILINNIVDHINAKHTELAMCDNQITLKYILQNIFSTLFWVKSILVVFRLLFIKVGCIFVI